MILSAIFLSRAYTEPTAMMENTEKCRFLTNAAKLLRLSGFNRLRLRSSNFSRTNMLPFVQQPPRLDRKQKFYIYKLFRQIFSEVRKSSRKSLAGSQVA
jgi:hypothetical protein